VAQLRQPRALQIVRDVGRHRRHRGFALGHCAAMIARVRGGGPVSEQRLAKLSQVR
jgi:hypothetical protein